MIDFLMFRNNPIFSLSALMGNSYLFVLEENACDALSLGKASFHTYSHPEFHAVLRCPRLPGGSRAGTGAGCAEGRGLGTAGARVWPGVSAARGREHTAAAG